MLNHLDSALYTVKAEDTLQDIKVDMSQVDLSLLATS